MRNTKVDSKIQKVPHFSEESGEVYDVNLLVEKIDIGDFIKMMVSEDMEKFSLSLGGRFAVLYQFLRRTNWETCECSTAKAIKEDIAKKADIEPETIESHIRVFLKFRVMRRKSAGLYMINPLMFFWGDRSKQKKLALIYLGKEPVE